MSNEFPSSDEKEQPWKKFWPPNLEQFSKEELIDNPWLGLCGGGGKPDGDPDPDGKPWYDWLRKDNDVSEQRPGYVCRRGNG
ncbi:hypothetical protein F4819DRAFT_451931 [Hypoxylon fuscum]|nr:hypothetical protein F4819DRAFT_451931 [Hypoxylon fuscum]